MNQLFSDKDLDSSAFLGGGSLIARHRILTTSTLRMITIKHRESEISLECHENRCPTLRLFCSYGDINLVASAIARGENMYNGFTDSDVKTVRAFSSTKDFYLAQPDRTVTLDFTGNDRFELKVRRRGVPGSLISVWVNESHIRNVSSRLLTGKFL